MLLKDSFLFAIIIYIPIVKFEQVQEVVSNLSHEVVYISLYIPTLSMLKITFNSFMQKSSDCFNCEVPLLVQTVQH